MWKIKKEYIGKTAYFRGRSILLKEKMSKKDIAFLKKMNYEGLEYVEDKKDIHDSQPDRQPE